MDNVEKITTNGIQIEIAKAALTTETLTYAHKIAELYEIEQDRIMNYVIEKTFDSYGTQYTAEEIKEKLHKPHIEIFSKNTGALVWLNHELDEHIITCEFGNDLQLSYVTLDG